MKDKNSSLAIKAFNLVRDLPYVLGTETTDCSCSAKVRLLGELLTRLNYDTKVMICDFDWRDLSIPADLAALAVKTFGVRNRHYLLGVKSKGPKGNTSRWIKVDPAWDIGLKSIFPISAWDGESNTTLAVTATNIRFLQQDGRPMEPIDLPAKNRLTSVFAKKFNHYLSLVRSQP